jgi:hypothetical protein
MENKPKKRARKMAQISPKFPVYIFINIIKYQTRPSFTAIKIVEKLSSSRTMSALWKWLSH